MRTAIPFWAILLCLVTTSIAEAQFQPVPPPMPAPSPLMYVRFNGPKGAKITVYRGFDKGQTLELPCTLGFRPGYSYRLALFDLPSFPRHVFCPSLDVRGTLALQPKLRNADFPANIHFTEEEMLKVFLGTYVRKAIALERPDEAIPVASKASEPLEIPVGPSRDPVEEAAQRGIPLIVYQIGPRFFTPQELNAQAIPGTVLLPGERVLGLPRVPPYFPWQHCPVYDPLLGPRHPSEFVTIYDGGDSGPRAGFDRFNRLKGLDSTDTIAEYLDSKGVKKYAASNRVGVCVPRFVVIKGELTHATQGTRMGLDTAQALAAPSAAVGKASTKEQSQHQHAEGLDGKVRLGGTFHTLGTSVMGRSQGLAIKSNLRSPESVQAVKMGPRELEPEDGPLIIIKWPDLTCVNVGDIVTFYLKYSNTGGQPITNVVVSDSLAARFEYVKGSTKTDRDALFTMQPNEAGSSILRWEFTRELQPREHGLITFQVRVR